MQVLAANWWTFVLRGLCGVIFGILTFLMPGMALLTLVFLFGFYALADGVFNLVAAFRRGEPKAAPWWALLISGILSIIAGVIAFFAPGITAFVLLIMIGAWAVVTGIMQIVAAIRLRKEIEGEWILALSGVLSILFGVLVLIFPGAGALAVVLWIGAFMFAYGIMLIALGFRLRSVARKAARGLEAHPHDGGFHGVIPSH